MIKIIHKDNLIEEVIIHNKAFEEYKGLYVVEVFIRICSSYPNEKIIWVNNAIKNFINYSAIENLKFNNFSIHFFSANKKLYLHRWIGYVDQISLFKINYQKLFQTWAISSDIGIVKGELINEICKKIEFSEENFDLFLNTIGFNLKMNSVFFYSNPELLLENYTANFTNECTENEVISYIKKNFDFKWYLILFLNVLIYERRFLIFPFFRNLFKHKTKITKYKFNFFKLNQIDIPKLTIDVIIPSIGREKELYGVFDCLRNQTYLPNQVVLVEQNPIQNTESNLNWIKDEKWPFHIEHIYINQTGVCNARNIALSKVKSEWVFMCDDDNIFENTLLQNVLSLIEKYNFSSVSLAYPQKNETVDYKFVHQTTIYGSGNSFIPSSVIKNCYFDKNYEFCYGEDFDYGMQLRNQGLDVVYLPEPIIIHLKAPMGGYRIKPVLPWSNDAIAPNPSPTILLNFLKYKTKEQLLSYKTLYFYNKLVKSKLKFYSTFKKVKLQWRASEIWAKRLMTND